MGETFFANGTSIVKSCPTQGRRFRLVMDAGISPGCDGKPCPDYHTEVLYENFELT
jgi:hypothetical protein